uniref:VWFA domain-containing protein n=1 Tax=Timema douglasi TaxID=61478 RepID=A0A7R8Z5B4_TIMDO|nr:unnamed protein product [Timema douglasi]
MGCLDSSTFIITHFYEPCWDAGAKTDEVDNWAKKLGVELWHCGGYVTRRDEILESYKEATVDERNAATLVQDIAREIKNMTDLKISAVRRIMDAAENTAMSHQEEEVTKYEYYNVKRIKNPGEPLKEKEMEMLLTPNKHFNNIPVNTSYSAVHVPTNVYDEAPDILKAIKWSSNLDTIFTNNYEADPSLSWQYFGSSTGFMRQYPAMQWKYDPVDLYDCRTRSWFIEAATSPKDMLILVDDSGSMTGMRKEIARHVVNNILDTLGNNDFVNVFNFSDGIGEVMKCYKESQDTLVQANLLNIRELKQAMKELYTDKIANFSAVLTKAFEILQNYREERKGACCNQAIMLITDGVPYNYKEIFELYNWQNLPFMPVRVFTYLIGREVPDVREVKWMACENRGYYVHLSTLAEVREQVLQYIPVMARPMVLWRNEHPTIWTPVYADITDPKMTDWLWEEKESQEQKDRYMSFHTGKFRYVSDEEQDRKYIQKSLEDNENDLGRYQLMTSVSMPVFDRRENATKIANLLGVAGTDVPIQDIKKLLMPHRFQGILKPAYNSVDMSEVELMDDDREARDVNPKMILFREAVVNQSHGSTMLNVKYHYDNMRRVNTVKRTYHYIGIENTPFTLVVTIPESYGRSKVVAQLETHLMRSQGYSVTKYFQGKNWKIHPDWTYCYYHYDTEHQFDTPEQELYHFLERTQQPKWHWKSKRTVTPPEHVTQCDRDLFLSLVFDAKATEWFSKNFSSSSKEEKGQQFRQRFGITITFVATHSGLTRWQDMPGMEDNKKEPHFSMVHNRAIDEVWYQRAVEQHEFEPDCFVYSVPFDAASRNDTLVTASHAVFIKSSGRTAPAAVVGFQFQHSALLALFKNITYATCESDALGCYVLDNNAYIVVSKEIKDTGRFFGDIDGYVMENLVKEKIYKKIHMFDYQAVCFRGEPTKSQGSILMTPLNHLKWMLEWTLANALWMFAQTNLHHMWYGDGAYGSEHRDYDGLYVDSVNTNEDDEEGEESEGTAKPTDPPYEKMQINRTRPDACDAEMDLYKLVKYSQKDQSPYQNKQMACMRPYVVQAIPYSNMILLVVDLTCPRTAVPMSIFPIEVEYRNFSLACYKAHFFDLHRTRPLSCINNHTKESEIEHLCGGSSIIQLSLLLLFPSWALAYFVFSER